MLVWLQPPPAGGEESWGEGERKKGVSWAVRGCTSALRAETRECRRCPEIGEASLNSSGYFSWLVCSKWTGKGMGKERKDYVSI